MLKEPETEGFKLYLEDLKNAWHKKYYTTKGYLYMLVVILSQDAPLEISNVTEFCREWEIERKSFYKAKDTLIKQGRIEVKQSESSMFLTQIRQ
ncbi:MAG: hypothetical protein HC856_00245 [Pseudanabaena sp. RU_4_16]|nr:hypothetical protein [Pseudanabaena sp. SU_2_4]NJM27074.1 hypothetical protein [Pseudanabaena sp. RU_4_16]NKB17127.1 hypothetical protein [Pseudanabaena sp. CRU_2_10]